ncbi:Gfo/Idh/MocA family protein [Desertivirga arenae]|uniref:Gfo/Idh/MocA family protein n=1 Tax=Desertivirga arenae TaxID=2810309 RepID=UPI001A97B5CC|nr:Gfo/Idh/MocA family oxidoreductase [Pedobacter sp. SYSU D00823]
MVELVRFAVAGAGHIGRRHISILQDLPDVKLVAVIDPKPISASLGAHYFPSIHAFLESGIKADILTIATPNGLHATQALEALQRKLHVLIEKPLALDKDAAEKIIAKADEVGKNWFTVLPNRYSYPARWLTQMVETGRLGKIFLVQVNGFWNRDERYYQEASWRGTRTLDGGPLYTQFSHCIDLLYWIFGDFKNIQAKFNNFRHQNLTEVEDTGFVNFDFISGGMGSLTYTTAVMNHNLETTLTVIAEKGTIKIGGQYMDTITYFDVKEYDASEMDLNQHPGNNHALIIADVIDIIRGKKKKDVSSEEVLRVIDIITEIYSFRDSG